MKIQLFAVKGLKSVPLARVEKGEDKNVEWAIFEDAQGHRFRVEATKSEAEIVRGMPWML